MNNLKEEIDKKLRIEGNKIDKFIDIMFEYSVINRIDLFQPSFMNGCVLILSISLKNCINENRR